MEQCGGNRGRKGYRPARIQEKLARDYPYHTRPATAFDCGEERVRRARYNAVRSQRANKDRSELWASSICMRRASTNLHIRTFTYYRRQPERQHYPSHQRVQPRKRKPETSIWFLAQLQKQERPSHAVYLVVFQRRNIFDIQKYSAIHLTAFAVPL